MNIIARTDYLENSKGRLLTQLKLNAREAKLRPKMR